jgi:hypothetical protein
MVRNVVFLGLLANVDSSIMNLKLKHGLKIESMDVTPGINLIGNLENSNPDDAYVLINDFKCLNVSESKIYFITKTIRAEKIMGGGISAFSNKVIHEYLTPVLKSIRLFKMGNICMPLSYYYYSDISPSHASMKSFTWIFIARELFSLGSDSRKIQNFLKTTKLPFRESFLQLAFQNFETSYDIPFRHMPYVLLMMSLEALFNRGESEIASTIARNTAVLLGKDKSDSDSIYKNVKKLYKKRNHLVHRGTADITEDDLQLLRYYVRESIKMVSKIGKNKDDLAHLLNSHGFDDRSKF